MNSEWHCSIPAADDGVKVCSWPVEPLSEGDAAWEPPRFLRSIWDFLGHCCQWLFTFLLFPLLGVIIVALPISMLACCIFYASELPVRILCGVCIAFFALALPVLVGTFALLAVIVITTACRRIAGLSQRIIRLFTQKPASLRLKAKPSLGKADLEDGWLDGV